MKYLHGGRPDGIVQAGDRLYRPAGSWTNQVHYLLSYLRKEGFLSAPEPLGFDESRREIVSFIKGDVSNYPLTPNAASIKALTSSATLLRDYHNASQGFLSNHVSDPTKWQLPCRAPQEVICHGDFAPYNVVLNGQAAIGIIDFDTCHPGPREWDVAYALYRWSPFMNPNNKDGFGVIEDQIARARIFCNAYGLSENSRKMMPSLMIERLQSLVDFMLIKEGDEIFKLNIEAGHHNGYLADIEYIGEHNSHIAIGLTES